MTDAYAIEIDFIKKWHEGLGQAIHYGDESNRIGVLALIVENKAHNDLDQIMLLKKIERFIDHNNDKLYLFVLNKNLSLPYNSPALEGIIYANAIKFYPGFEKARNIIDELKMRTDLQRYFLMFNCSALDIFDNTLVT